MANAQKFKLNLNLGNPFFANFDGKALSKENTIAMAFGVKCSDDDDSDDVEVEGSVSPDGLTLNTTTTVEDCKPKPEDYVYVAFRALTATIVASETWRSTDFTGDGVLKAAMPFLIGKQVYKDHGTWTIDNVCGIVTSATYSGTSVGADGTVVPAGIDVLLRFDVKLQSDLVRKLLSEPAEIQSCSVGVSFMWEPSHNFTKGDGTFDWNVFYQALGGPGEDGAQVTRVVTEVLGIDEISLVTFGADPYAKILDANGIPVNIDTKAIATFSKFTELGQSEKEYCEKEQSIFAVETYSKSQTKAIQEQYQSGINKPVIAEPAKTEQTEDSDMKLSLALAQHFGIEAEKVNEQFIKELAEKFKAEAETAQKEKAELLAANTLLSADLATAKAGIELAKPAVEQYNKQLTSLRSEAVRLFKIRNKDLPGMQNGAANFAKTLETMDLEGIKFTLAAIGGKVAETFGATCTKCGATGEAITLQSSQAVDTTTAEKLGAEPETKFYNRENDLTLRNQL